MVLKTLLSFLSKVLAYSKQNKMGASNLAVVFTPHLVQQIIKHELRLRGQFLNFFPPIGVQIRSEDSGPGSPSGVDYLSETPVAQAVVTTLIEHEEKILHLAEQKNPTLGNPPPIKLTIPTSSPQISSSTASPVLTRRSTYDALPKLPVLPQQVMDHISPSAPPPPLPAARPTPPSPYKPTPLLSKVPSLGAAGLAALKPQPPPIPPPSPAKLSYQPSSVKLNHQPSPVKLNHQPSPIRTPSGLSLTPAAASPVIPPSVGCSSSCACASLVANLR